MKVENSTIDKLDIRSLSLEMLTTHMKEAGEPTFRARQVYEWLWKKSCNDFEDMTNLSLKLREWLESHYEFRNIQLEEEKVSSDLTIKSTFRLYDGNLIEGVLIPTENRMTACISSQVGCSLSCKFCATGYLERLRNLTPAEIYDQVVLIRKQAEKFYQKPLTNIVFMGMGEPLLNYANVMEGINFITSPEGLDISTKRITLSTAGIAKMIKKLADDQVKFNLALSLHAANDEKRNQIMAINETNSLDALQKALQYFYNKTRNKITFEYIVFHQFNDSIRDARLLYEITKRVPSKVNLIEYNPISQASFTNTTEDRLTSFSEFLLKKGVSVSLRRSRGKDIDAACGQLAGKKTS